LSQYNLDGISPTLDKAGTTVRFPVDGMRGEAGGQQEAVFL
jgi:hypothetical protein